MDDRAVTTLRAARAAGTVAETSFRTGIRAETKASETDLVTQADRDAQEQAVLTIDDRYPDEPIVGEEGDLPKEVPSEGRAWVIDPIDGTSNFVRGVRTWCSAVAAVRDGDAVAAANVFPALGDDYVLADGTVRLNDEEVTTSDVADPELGTVAPLLWWNWGHRDEFTAICEGCVERFDDLRRIGSAQAVLSMVAAGHLDAAVTNLQAYHWDAIGGVAMVRAAGGTVTDTDGERWTPDSRGLVASNGEVHDAALAAVDDV